MPRNRYFTASLVSLLLLMASAAFGQAWSGMLSPSRATNWSSAGIPGGIPSDSWSQCGPTIAAYSGSPSTILNALNHSGAGYTGCSANTYVKLGPGTFTLSSSIRNVGVSNSELRGSGTTQTILRYSGTGTCQGGNGGCLIGFESSDNTCPNCGSPTHLYNVTGGLSQGSTSITLSSGSAITANSTMLIMDQCDTGYSGAPCSGQSPADNGNYFNCSDAYNPSNQTGCSFNASNAGSARTHRFQMEILEATSCSPSCGNSGSTTVTIKPALQHPNWASGQTPQVWLIQPASRVGFRDLTVDGTNTSATAGVSFYNVTYGWLKNVAVLHAHSIGVYLTQTAHMQIESNYVFDAGQGNPGNDPSAINYTGSNNLIVNNIIQNNHTGTFGNGPVSGNVIAYNYITNCYTGDGFLFGCIWDGHSNGADYNLFEGNVAAQTFQDQTHGTHLMETWYRNFFTGWESCGHGNCGSNSSKTNDVAAIEDLSYNRYGNFVANVLGTPGVTTAGYQSSTNEYVTGGTSGVVYVLGSGNQTSPPNTDGGPIPMDSMVPKTTLRWGNWDAFNNSTQWNTSEVPSNISMYPNPVPTSCTAGSDCPASLFLSGRPTWWSSSIPFPAIGPDVEGGNVGQCTGSPNASGQFGGLPALSNSQCTGTSLNSAWAGHVNGIPAMACYLSVLNGPPDGSGNALPFDGTACYASTSTGSAPAAPTGLQAVVQ